MKKNMLKEALKALEVLEGPFAQFIKNLRGKNGELWFAEFKKFLRQESCWTSVQEMTRDTVLSTSFLYLFPFFEKLTIKELDGKRFIAGLNELFPSGQKLFHALNLIGYGKKTKKSEVLIYKLKKEVNLCDIFYSFGHDLKKLCFSQAQIIETVKEYPEIFIKDVFNNGLFLFEKDCEVPSTLDNLFVAVISRRSKDEDHAQEYELFIEAIPMNIYAKQKKFGQRDVVFIPKPIKRKNWLVRWSNWLAKIN